MELNDKTILQINIPSVVGALIFLSISSILSGENILPAVDEPQINQTDLIRVLPMIQILITFFLLIPFAIAGSTMIQENLIGILCF